MPRLSYLLSPLATLALAACAYNNATPALRYTLTFNVRGGTHLDPIAVERGKTAARPLDPSKKDGATMFDRPLEQWYADDALQHPFSFSGAITSDTTIYAKYDNAIYLISTEAQLRAVAHNLRGHYRLQGDIALASPWTPLGDYNTAFTGRFEGQGYAIRHMRISATENAAGLFRLLDPSGVIDALGIEVSGITGVSHVGALVGENRGLVSGYAVGGKIIGQGYNVGGLVGWNTGKEAIVVGYTALDVEGNIGVGGLVGWNGNQSVAMGYTVGKITGKSNVGGLVGSNESLAIGYMRGAVSRYPDLEQYERYGAFGLLVGYNINKASAAGYHSGKAGESQLVGFVAGEQLLGFHGSPATASPYADRYRFLQFKFGSALGEWLFTKPGHWPAISLGSGMLVDAQDVLTLPTLHTAP